jgi:hypothetical protein
MGEGNLQGLSVISKLVTMFHPQSTFQIFQKSYLTTPIKSVSLSQSKELWVVPVAAVEEELQADVRIMVLVVLADVVN